jgi:hypothetical protein
MELIHLMRVFSNSVLRGSIRINESNTGPLVASIKNKKSKARRENSKRLNKLEQMILNLKGKTIINTLGEEASPEEKGPSFFSNDLRITRNVGLL